MTKPDDISDEVWAEADDVHEKLSSLRVPGRDTETAVIARALAAAEKRGMERAAKIAERTTKAPGQRNAKDLWVEQIGQRVGAAIRSEW